MTPVEFLRAVWPRTGHYCLYARIGKRAHWVYDSIDEAAAAAVYKAHQGDVYFAIHSLRERQVDSLNERNEDGTPKKQIRVQRNMLVARCFYLDIDVGVGKPYQSQAEALGALRKFCQETGLPRPMVTSSGGGIHVYWTLTNDLPSEEWRDWATQLKQLTDHYGLQADNKVTTDSARVLRVIGTLNYKDANNPRPVAVLIPGVETATGVFTNLIKEAIIRAGVTPQEALRWDTGEADYIKQLGNNTEATYDGPKPSMAAVFTACAQMARLGMLKGKFTENEWYHGAIGIGRFTEEGNRGVHKLSVGHPGYNEAACNAKIKQSEEKQRGPSSCRSLVSASDVGEKLCLGCPFQGKGWGPIQAALKRDEVAAPVITELVAGVAVTTTIPNPPKPFSRTKTGIVVEMKNADGSVEHVTVYDYDLYPIRRMANAHAGTEQHLWHVELPHGESKDFILEADMLYDQKRFVVAVTNQGIYPHHNHLPTLREYMTAYIKELQKLSAAEAQNSHLGWSDDYSKFILPDKLLLEDGTAKGSQLSIGAQRASLDVHKKGTLQRQVELLRFYNRPEYVPHQFMICASLGATIFYATGHHGVIINASGEAGASKSTALYSAASLWGNPKLYPINGTDDGATPKARAERVHVLANLPVCVDEITNMSQREAVNLAMGITQPGHRIRLQTDGVERVRPGSHKATMLLATANSSLHNLLSQENAQGTAGSMRVFEIGFKKTFVHKKHEADEYLLGLNNNYGHVGEQFILHTIRHRVAVEERVRVVQRQVDERFDVQPSERFWSAGAAATIVGGEIGNQLGLLSYSIDGIWAWLGHQIHAMRGVVAEEYSDPLSFLSNYMEKQNNHFIVIKSIISGTQKITTTVRLPVGELVGHYDLDDGMLYVLKSAFKEYCAKTGANSSAILRDLEMPRDGVKIVPQRNTRRVLGAGTDFAKGQTWCFAVNMRHPAISGQTNMTIVTGGQPSAPPAGNLKAVP